MKTFPRFTLIPWLACAAIFCSYSKAQAQIVDPRPGLAKARSVEASGNLRQIGFALLEFDSNYGSFPSEKSFAVLEEEAGIKLPAGDKSSNALFRQLFAAGIISSEVPFYAKIPGTAKGAMKVEPAKALAQGKNAFAYIAGLSSAGNPARPIIVSPLIPRTTKFDPKPYGGKAIILRIDNSVQFLPISADGTVLVDGVELLSKDHPIWDGKAPDIRYPDLLPPEE